MTDNINILNLPVETVYGKFIPKEKLYNHADINASIKEKFVRQVERITWTNKISPETVNVKPGKYSEIEVFRIDLKESNIDDKLIQIVDRAIPYPILFVICYNDYFYLTMPYKDGANIGLYFKSGWTSTMDLTLTGLTIDQIYANILRTIDNSLKSDELSLDEAVKQYAEQRQIQKRIDQLAKQIAKEPNSARRQELAKERAGLWRLYEN